MLARKILNNVNVVEMTDFCLSLSGSWIRYRNYNVVYEDRNLLLIFQFKTP